MQYLVLLPKKYTKPYWHYNLWLRLFWGRKCDWWRTQSSSLWQGGHTHTRDKERNNLLHLLQTQLLLGRIQAWDSGDSTIIWASGYRKPSCLSPLWRVFLPSVAAKGGLKHSLPLNKCLHTKNAYCCYLGKEHKIFVPWKHRTFLITCNPLRFRCSSRDEALNVLPVL